jgi:V/A-type H+-transporting ATPase subunit A
MAMGAEQGEVNRVSGPVVTATGIQPRMYDVVFVGEQQLMGEVIRVVGGKSIIQVYEDTSGIKPGEKVLNSRQPLSLELGPGLLTRIYDGIQRPLPELKDQQGDFISRGARADGLDHKKKWTFVPGLKAGDKLAGGEVIGTVQETRFIKHRVLAPPDAKGTVASISEGDYTVEENVLTLDSGRSLTMMQRWPVRVPRPFKEKLMPDIPLITGQRIFDGLFPVAKGGTAAIPGPFGSGKTVSQHQLAKWSDTDVVVYVGCGERGNEMTEVLVEFPHLDDPKTGAPLMERTVLIANTSNMPVAAREASVYTGVTIAEYFRDMGYDVGLMADSTSRWAEAMREISSRLEEMPGEEGYPAYLAARLSQFYERAGRVKTIGGGQGSITIVGAVSPPGGDFSEPVTQNTLRIVKVFWALDAKLAQRRHFPAINWLQSYSLYGETLGQWFSQKVSKEWNSMTAQAMEILQKEAELQEIVQLVGSDALPEEQQLTLEVARLIREVFLQQNATHEVDSFCPLPKQYAIMRTILRYGDLGRKALELETPLQDIAGVGSKALLARARFEKAWETEVEKVNDQMTDEFRKMGVEV